MHFSSLWFWALAKELKPKLAGGKVVGGRVFQAGLVLTVEQVQAWDLLFWLDPRFPRVECLPSRGPHQLPGRFRVLQESIVADVVQPDSDRRLNLTLTTAEGDLALEYFGFARPALVLKDAKGGVVAAAGAEAPHPDRPGKTFLLDALNKGFRGDPRTLRGLDDLWLKAALGSESPWGFIEAAGKKLQSGQFTGYLVLEHGKPVGVSLLDFTRELPELAFEDCGSLSHASSRFVSTARRDQDLKGDRTAILTAAADLKSRLSKTLAELKRDRSRQSLHPELKENAEYLTSQLSRIRKGQAEITVPSAKGDRRVALDPRLKPHEQADRWYQEARRLKRGMETTQSRIEGIREKLDGLTQLVQQVEGRLDSEEPGVADAFAELEKLSEKARSKAAVRVKQEPVRFRRFRSPGGLAIWVGRNNTENDELTLHAAHKEDLWFHAQQTPGSHVVLRSHALNQTPARPDIVAAAATAAYYSRARTSKKVPVIYTLAKFVRKPRKAPAGTVTVEREKSIMVEPGLCPVWDAEA